MIVVPEEFGYAVPISKYEVAGMLIVCWKISLKERVRKPIDEEICSSLMGLAKETHEPVQIYVDEDSGNTYILLPVRGG